VERKIAMERFYVEIYCSYKFLLDEESTCRDSSYWFAKDLESLKPRLLELHAGFLKQGIKINYLNIKVYPNKEEKKPLLFHKVYIKKN